MNQRTQMNNNILLTCVFSTVLLAGSTPVLLAQTPGSAASFNDHISIFRTTTTSEWPVINLSPFPYSSGPGTLRGLSVGGYTYGGSPSNSWMVSTFSLNPDPGWGGGYFQWFPDAEGTSSNMTYGASGLSVEDAVVIHLNANEGVITIGESLVLTSDNYSGYVAGVFPTLAIGTGAVAYGLNSAAFGLDSVAQGYNQTVIGQYNTPLGTSTANSNPTDPLFIVGNGSDGGHRSNAFTIARNGDATVFGRLVSGAGASATGILSAAIGTSATAAGQQSIAIGRGAKADGYSQVVLGPFNDISGWVWENGWNPWASSQYAFVVGNGTDDLHRSNAFFVRRSSNVGIGKGAGWANFYDPGGGLDVAWGGGTTLLLGADLNEQTRTHQTNKMMSVRMPHYLTDKRPINIVSGYSDLFYNYVSIGSGDGSAPNYIDFNTAETRDAQWPPARMRIHGNGAIQAGTGVDAGVPGQFAVGKFNNIGLSTDGTYSHATGVFMIGAGQNAGDRKNALRVKDNGTVLVNPSGDISMGAFTAGEKP
jgi:hypothetical protein